MNVPFTTDQFLAVIADYNAAIGPIALLLLVAGVAMAGWGLRPSPRGDRAIPALLTFLWAWMGTVYHWGFFTTINPAAWLFGGMFVVEAVLLAWYGVAAGRLAFRFRPDTYGIVGALFLAYGLVVYPILGALAGHGYPDGPTFGLPCPTTIATFGILLWSTRRVPGWLLAIPAAWSLVGGSAAFQFGIPEDYGLIVAGVVGTALIVVRNRRARRVGAAPATAGAAR